MTPVPHGAARMPPGPDAGMIELDGSQGEGGGQILRTSLALSLITGRPFRLTNVRARRARPGLQPQHLTSVRAAAAVGAARVKGDAVGSRELTFEPGPVRPGDYHFPIGTAGATGLVLHTVYLPLAWKVRGPSTVRLEGGTHNDHAPCFHFNEVTWRRYLERLGLHVSLRMDRAGFYPRGGGKVEVRIEPCDRVAPLTLTEPAELTTVTGFSAVAGLPDGIARRQAEQATGRLEEAGLGVVMRQEVWPGGPGTVVGLWFHEAPVPTLFFGLGARGKRAEAVADEAV